MSPCANIILVGLSGAGKTSCAQALAELLELQVLDTDEVIQKRQGGTVAAIFAEQGEAHFRALETALIEEFLAGGLAATVVSVGGGLPAQGENARLLKELGFMVFLDAQPAVLARRLAEDLSRDHSLRPLLAAGGDCKEESGGQGLASQTKVQAIEATLTAQLAKRRCFYEQAHLVINTEGKSPREICREIQTMIINNASETPA